MLAGEPESCTIYPQPDLPVLPASTLPEDRAMVRLVQTKMPGAILTKVDRMSMAASLEVRPPLLDQRVVEFARRVPLDLKVRRGTGKYLLREAGRPLLPPVVYEQRKQGFAIPLRDWLNDRFWEQLGDLYAPGSPAARLFRQTELDRTIRDAREGASAGRVSEQGAAARVWLLAMVARWMQLYDVRA